MKRNRGFFIYLFIFLLVCGFVVATAYGPKIETTNYVVSRSKIDRSVNQGELFTEIIGITNLKSSDLTVKFSFDEGISDIVSFNNSEIVVAPGNSSDFEFIVQGKAVGNYSGNIVLSGDLEEKIPVNITVVDDIGDPPVIIRSRFDDKIFTLSGSIGFKLDVQKLKPATIDGAMINYSLILPSNATISLGGDVVNITSSFQLVKEFEVPENLEKGDYVLETTLFYEGRSVENKAQIKLRVAFLHLRVFGFLPMWLLLTIIGTIIVGLLVYYFVRKSIESKKKYKMQLDLKTLPQKTPGFFYLGKIAEKKNSFYFDPLKLKTHSIVAGATGGGKSITAQVMIEEALINNVAVIVFDPTAQWSGMLRKCTDKKMMSYYPKFGLKETDSRAFKGNVRQIQDARQIIDVRKYMSPGQIMIFSLNKLQPNEMDTFVANVIREIFKGDPKETPELKLLLVFDEVHRLLAKFGGSGEGFLQIERACREFRKWGMGVMLVSQVLADFVGEIKANISTEIQMRTRDEGDLERIKTKFGPDFLQSLVKASVGVGMVVNPSYNHAKPFFINFRPILHNTRRLSDEELEKYNKYNDILDDLEYQIEQLKELGTDVFDLNMEVKLMKDKVMGGNFAVVEIYLEGLRPRVEKEWARLGKKPKKLEIKLASEEEIRKSVEEAKKERAKAEKAEKKEEGEKKEEEKEDITQKIVASLTFDNGIMVSSLKELKDVLPNLDDEIFSLAVNDEKNDIAKWVGENFGAAEGDKLKGVTDKAKIVEALANIGKVEEKSKEEKKSGDKKEEKKESKTDDKKEEKKTEEKTDGKKEDKKEEKKEDSKNEKKK